MLTYQVADMSLVAYAGVAQDKAAEACGLVHTMCPHTIYVSSYYYILLLQVADMSLVEYASTPEDEAAEACVRAAFKRLPQGTPCATSAEGFMH